MTYTNLSNIHSSDIENENLPYISIIIPTRNVKTTLKRCLNAIFKQSYPKSKFEVIIVNNGLTDDALEIKKDFPQIKYVHEKKQGIPFTYNAGLAVAKGSVIIYTNDDCIVDGKWMESLVSGFFKVPKVIGVGGPVYPFNVNGLSKKFLSNLSLLLATYDEGERMKYTECLNTGNCAFRREIFEKFRFDENLRRGVDSSFCKDLVRAGYRLLYLPQAKVYHIIKPYQIGIKYVLKRAFYFAVGGVLPNYRKRLSKSKPIFLRIRMLRYIIGQLVQHLFHFLKSPSFNNCYRLFESGIFPLVFTITFADLLPVDVLHGR
jgi:glycosyltransferase involved in cell wall biosynthesis